MNTTARELPLEKIASIDDFKKKKDLLRKILNSFGKLVKKGVFIYNGKGLILTDNQQIALDEIVLKESRKTKVKISEGEQELFEMIGQINKIANGKYAVYKDGQIILDSDLQNDANDMFTTLPFGSEVIDDKDRYSAGNSEEFNIGHNTIKLKALFVKKVPQANKKPKQKLD